MKWRATTTIDLSQWRTRIAEWQKQKAGPFSAWVRRLSDELPKIGSIFVNSIFCVLSGPIIWFFEPASLLQITAILLIGFTLFLFQSNRRLQAGAVLFCLLGLVVFKSVTASYLIASDQNRFRYRTIEERSYLEFPLPPKNLAWIVNWVGADRILTVEFCDDTKVVVLPLLPYRPLFPKDNAIDETGFRRLPPFKFHRTQLTVEAIVNPPQLTRRADHSAFNSGLAPETTIQRR